MKRTASLFVLFVLSGCGWLIGVDSERPLMKDAAPDDRADAARDADLGCDLDAPFEAPREITELSTTKSEFHPTLTADELTMFFLSDQGAEEWVHEIWTTTRATRSSPWSKPKIVPELASKNAQDTGVSVSADGLDIYVTTYDLVKKKDVRHARRSSVGEPFGTLTPIASTPNNDFELHVTPTRNIYVAVEDGPMRLWFVPFEGASWGAPAQLSLVPFAGEAVHFPALSADEKTIYFVTSQPERPETSRVFKATRSTTQAPFGEPAPAPDLQVADHGEAPSWISPDGCRMYMATFTFSPDSFQNGRGYWDLAVASKPKKK